MGGDLILGAVEPCGIDLDPPARRVADGRVAIFDLVGVVDEEILLPRVVIRAFDGELKILPRVRDRAQQVHGAQGDEREVGGVGCHLEAMGRVHGAARPSEG